MRALTTISVPVAIQYRAELHQRRVLVRPDPVVPAHLLNGALRPDR
jgi:hypothetical protein